MKKSVPTIVDIIDYLKTNSQVKLAGLEHLDERYIRAIKYNIKSSRSDMPKMVLLGDITLNPEETSGQIEVAPPQLLLIQMHLR
jgi:FAD/FMN-containing dehydrogenase